MKKVNIISVGIIFVSFLIASLSYNIMPDQMASHWNAAGEVDGYMLKIWGLYLMPIISMFIYLIALIIPKIDPLKSNINKFKKYFDIFILIILLFLFYIYLLTIFINLGYELEMNYMILPALSVLFYFIGIMLAKAERNWFIGIRTPWTLSNDIVWKKTHKLGAKGFKVLSILILVGMFFGEYSIYFIIVPILVFVVFLFLYSYVIYKKICNDSN